ncbi:uncharacterized protein LOC121088116 isoform X1 [Falco naumanni]|uniref:uncharacterized protein LOC121088116 isoform X1 n=1 Tax=Falco naumanni TaxID=148594 RepID=UPI001ADE6C1E|nr:uncharacterized protein LOC121088116 isoform X1 [Falco naumanni]
MGLSPPRGPPHASTFQPTTIQGQPPAPARSRHPSAPRLPSAFHVRLKMSPAGTILCPTSPGLRGQPCSPSSWGRHLPPNHLDDYGPGFYCHKCFVQEQQYPPEGAVLSLEIATLPLHRLGAKDAFAAPRPHTWSASESLLALPKTTGRDKAKRRRVRVIFKAGTHLERADGLEGIPVVSGNQEIIHSGGSANDRGAWRPQPGPRGPVILDLTYTEEEMSAHRGTGRARGDERQRMNVNAVSHQHSPQQSIPDVSPPCPFCQAVLPARRSRRSKRGPHPSSPPTLTTALCIWLVFQGSCPSFPVPRTCPASSDTSSASFDTFYTLLGLLSVALALWHAPLFKTFKINAFPLLFLGLYRYFKCIYFSSINAW